MSDIDSREVSRKSDSIDLLDYLFDPRGMDGLTEGGDPVVFFPTGPRTPLKRKPYAMKPMVNKPLFRSYFWGGYVRVRLTSHSEANKSPLKIDAWKMFAF